MKKTKYALKLLNKYHCGGACNNTTVPPCSLVFIKGNQKEHSQGLEALPLNLLPRKDKVQGRREQRLPKS